MNVMTIEVISQQPDASGLTEFYVEYKCNKSGQHRKATITKNLEEFIQEQSTQYEIELI
jgi:hypothetical protein